MQSLYEINKSRVNSITFLRLLAACAVIYGHSYAVVPGFGGDWVVKLTNYAHAGGVAVDFFFILSGYLVCGSILKRGAISYISARLLRMIPALWFFTIMMVFVIGPILTNQKINDYFSASQTWRYFINLSFLIETEWFLPGVFEDQHNKAINGSIWSVVLEFRMYIYTLLFFMLGVLKNRIFFNFTFVTIIILVWSAKITLPGIQGSTDLHVAFLFFTGCFIYKNQDYIFASPISILIGLTMAAITHNTPNFQYAYTLLIVLLFIHVSFIKTFSWMDRIGDFSYGVYLWGWPVQQMVFKFNPNQTPIENCLISIAVCLIIGFFSWHLVEKRALKHKDVLPNYIERLKLRLKGVNS
jgi:peptidoglycan/LPS O-acetylase OafA/YrhL